MQKERTNRAEAPERLFWKGLREIPFYVLLPGPLKICQEARDGCRGI
jgi:hypothetical protein